MRHILTKRKCLIWTLVLITSTFCIYLKNQISTDGTVKLSGTQEMLKIKAVNISKAKRPVEKICAEHQVILNRESVNSSNVQAPKAIVVHKGSSKLKDVILMKIIDHVDKIKHRVSQPGYSVEYCKKVETEYPVAQKSNYAVSIKSTTKKSLRYEETYEKSVVIMTPISNNADQLLSYFQLICSLSYPHRLISVVLGEDSSRDRTFEEAVKLSQKVPHQFNSIKVYRFNMTMKDKYLVDRHTPAFQLIRRSHLAKVRNSILKKGLLPEHDYVLWIDSDVKCVPHDIIQHLIFEDKDVIVPACLYINDTYNNKYDTYDRNTWQETEKSLEFLQNLSSTRLIEEGFRKSLRLYLHDITNQGLVVKLDGVGGCVLMVKAQCFRKGLKFPETIYENHIETEGMAKMARRMNFGVYGLPFVNVLHP